MIIFKIKKNIIRLIYLIIIVYYIIIYSRIKEVLIGNKKFDYIIILTNIGYFLSQIKTCFRLNFLNIIIITYYFKFFSLFYDCKYYIYN